MAQKAKAEPKYDHLFKVLLIGDSGCGKTQIMAKFNTVRTVPELTLAGPLTTGIDFVLKTVDIDGERVKLQVWDTAGQERFQSITTSYYRGACGIMLVYDVRCRESFDNLHRWLRNIDDNTENIVKILVGNHNEDTEKKVVLTEEAGHFAQEHGLELFEISSEDGDQIEKMFLALARKILHVIKEKKAAAAATVAMSEKHDHTDKQCLI